MSGGSHRAQGGGIRWPVLAVVVVLLVLIAGGAWFLFLREGAPISLDGEREVPEFSFDLGVIRGIPVTEPANGSTLESAAEDVRETLDAMYVAAFIDPEKWEGGEFPEVLEAFTGSAAKRASKDLDSLTLGADAEQTEFVNPETGRLNVRFLVDQDQTLSAAVATASFSAGGALKDGRGLIVQHEGTYYMRPDGDRWLIVGYQVRGIVTTRAKEPAAGASP